MELRHFDPKKQIKVDIAKLGLDLMHDLFKVGDEYLAEWEKTRAAEKLKVEAKKGQWREACRAQREESEGLEGHGAVVSGSAYRPSREPTCAPACGRVCSKDPLSGGTFDQKRYASSRGV